MLVVMRLISMGRVLKLAVRMIVLAGVTFVWMHDADADMLIGVCVPVFMAMTVVVLVRMTVHLAAVPVFMFVHVLVNVLVRMRMRLDGRVLRGHDELLLPLQWG